MGGWHPAAVTGEVRATGALGPSALRFLSLSLRPAREVGTVTPSGSTAQAAPPSITLSITPSLEPSPQPSPLCPAQTWGWGSGEGGRQDALLPLLLPFLSG